MKELITLKDITRGFGVMNTTPWIVMVNQDRKLPEEFENNGIEWITSLTEGTKDWSHQLNPTHIIYRPKGRFGLRPDYIMKYTDHLLYSTLVAKIATEAYPTLSATYDHITFGNQVTDPSTVKSPSTDPIFRNWQDSWKKFNDLSQSLVENEYKYYANFDVAGFYENIDHGVLRDILLDVHYIDADLVEYLIHCLGIWNRDLGGNKRTSSKGIPQGPIVSAILAELVMQELDKLVINASNLNFRYIRYMDDIRVFSNDYSTVQSIALQVDGSLRSLCLTPQSAKTKVKEYKQGEVAFYNPDLPFQEVIAEYIASSKKKAERKISLKTHKNLKKWLVDSITCSPDLPQYQHKTIIKFCLYKLNADKAILQILLKNFDALFGHTDPVLYYIGRHFMSEPLVLKFLEKKILAPQTNSYVIAAILSRFPSLPFNEELFDKYSHSGRNWFVFESALSWVKANNRLDLIRDQKFATELLQMHSVAAKIRFFLEKQETQINAETNEAKPLDLNPNSSHQRELKPTKGKNGTANEFDLSNNQQQSSGSELISAGDFEKEEFIDQFGAIRKGSKQIITIEEGILVVKECVPDDSEMTLQELLQVVGQSYLN